MRDLLFDEDEVRGTVLPFVPEILPGPRGESKAEAITRANRSEALRANDLRQFVGALEARDKEIAAVREELREANKRKEHLEAMLATSASMAAMNEVLGHLERIRNAASVSIQAMERAK